MNANQITKGGEPISHRDPKLPGRHYTIQANDFTQAPSGEPIPVWAGTARRSGLYITPIFKLRAVAIKTKVGK